MKSLPEFVIPRTSVSVSGLCEGNHLALFAVYQPEQWSHESNQPTQTTTTPIPTNHFRKFEKLQNLRISTRKISILPLRRSGGCWKMISSLDSVGLKFIWIFSSSFCHGHTQRNGRQVSRLCWATM